MAARGTIRQPGTTSHLNCKFCKGTQFTYTTSDGALDPLYEPTLHFGCQSLTGIFLHIIMVRVMEILKTSIHKCKLILCFKKGGSSSSRNKPHTEEFLREKGHGEYRVNA